MNKFLLKLSLLASIAIVSVTNGAEPSSAIDFASPKGQHGSRHGGPASAFVSNERAGVIKKFPSAIIVSTWDGRKSRIAIDVNTTVAELLSTIEGLFELKGGHRYTLDNAEVMKKIVDDHNQLIKIRDLGWSADSIPTIEIVEDKTRSPKHSNSGTPAPQSGKISLDASGSANPEKAE